MDLIFGKWLRNESWEHEEEYNDFQRVYLIAENGSNVYGLVYKVKPLRKNVLLMRWNIGDFKGSANLLEEKDRRKTTRVLKYSHHLIGFVFSNLKKEMVF